MFQKNKNIQRSVAAFVFLLILFFMLLDWNVDGFELFKVQNYSFYFQSWISMAGFLFTVVMALTLYSMSRKEHSAPLRYIALSFLLTSFAFVSIGYHASYCEVCSNLAMCAGSHNYADYFMLFALVIYVLSILLSNIQRNYVLLKYFSLGLVGASLIMIMTLFFSIQFMEIPELLFYDFHAINMQGFVFVVPLMMLAVLFFYLKRIKRVTKTVLGVFVLLLFTLLPQAYHIFICTECHVMECSEFYTVSGFFLIAALASFMHAMRLYFENEQSK